MSISIVPRDMSQQSCPQLANNDNMVAVVVCRLHLLQNGWQ